MQLEDDDECDSDIGEEGESSGEEEVINVVATKSFDDAIFTKNEQNAEQKSTIYNKKNLEAVSKLQLIEYLIRLCSLEYSENTSHLNCYDEQINLCLKNDYDFTKNKLEQNVIGESRREVGELDSVLTNNENITLDKDSPFRIRSEESPRNVISKTPTKSLKNFDGKSSEHLSNKMRQLNIE
ncbi:hypothetical protein HK099_003163 [Clydaea vesicula]|uniref:Uncharacterized protein n=1 Tax=Clydaea vesicula TaxID=447962 RepID=A0AAD5TST8_9FUNG|nr:hypothetical protein HK099_003163 [Clydaea vesicula]